MDVPNGTDQGPLCQSERSTEASRTKEASEQYVSTTHPSSSRTASTAPASSAPPTYHEAVGLPSSTPTPQRVAVSRSLKQQRPATLDPAKIHIVPESPSVSSLGATPGASSPTLRAQNASGPLNRSTASTHTSPSSPTRKAKVHSPYSGEASVLRDINSPLVSLHGTCFMPSANPTYPFGAHNAVAGASSGGTLNGSATGVLRSASSNIQTPTRAFAEFPPGSPTAGKGSPRVLLPSRQVSGTSGDMAASFNSTMSGSMSPLNPPILGNAAGLGSAGLISSPTLSPNFQIRGGKVRERNICRHFLEGKCNRGSSCRFFHPGSKHKVITPKYPRSQTTKPITPLADLERQRQEDAARAAALSKAAPEGVTSASPDPSSPHQSQVSSSGSPGGMAPGHTPQQGSLPHHGAYTTAPYSSLPHSPATAPVNHFTSPTLTPFSNSGPSAPLYSQQPPPTNSHNGSTIPPLSTFSHTHTGTNASGFSYPQGTGVVAPALSSPSTGNNRNSPAAGSTGMGTPHTAQMATVSPNYGPCPGSGSFSQFIANHASSFSGGYHGSNGTPTQNNSLNSSMRRATATNGGQPATWGTAGSTGSTHNAPYTNANGNYGAVPTGYSIGSGSLAAASGTPLGTLPFPTLELPSTTYAGAAHQDQNQPNYPHNRLPLNTTDTAATSRGGPSNAGEGHAQVRSPMSPLVALPDTRIKREEGDAECRKTPSMSAPTLNAAGVTRTSSLVSGASKSVANSPSVGYHANANPGSSADDHALSVLTTPPPPATPPAYGKGNSPSPMTKVTMGDTPGQKASPSLRNDPYSWR